MESFLQSLTMNLDPTSLSLGQALSAIGVAYLGGVLTSLTPCVYPMIPITVGVIGGMGADRRSWLQIGLRGAAYVGGMSITYSFLGVLAGLTGRIFGTFTNGSGWYISLGTILTLAALVMFDVIPFDPQTWIEGLKRKFSGGQYRAPTPGQAREVTVVWAFVLGASSGLVAAPCTTPVLTAILAYIAKTQSIGMGLLLMMSFSIGLGSLLLVIAFFTGALQILPRSGNWMKTIKFLSALLLLGFAQYLFYRAGQAGTLGGS